MSKLSVTPVVVISAPSGTGKSKVCKGLIENWPDNYASSISHTTRAQSAQETNAKDYFFVSKEKFSQLVLQDYFIEHTNIYGNSYGTSFANLDAILQNGKSPLLDIDTKGGYNLQQHYPCMKFFLFPPSKEILKDRLLKRNRDSKETMQKRMQSIEIEINNSKQYDYFICNDDLAKTITTIHNIIQTVWPTSYHRQQDKLMAIIK